MTSVPALPQRSAQAGVEHGLSCIGCCIGLVVALVMEQKVPRLGERVSWATGVGLLAAALVTAIG